MKSADVVVIGGGIVGCAVAYYLAKSGVQVSLVEKRFMASGSSGAAQSNLSLQARTPGPELDLAIDSMRIYEDLEEELGYRIDFRRTGSLMFATKKDKWKEMQEKAEKQKEKNLNNTLLRGHQLKDFENVLCCDGIVGAVLNNDDAIVNCIRVNVGYSIAIQRLGVRIFNYTEVTDVRVVNHKVVSVVTSEGEIKTNVVVNAAGAWSSHIGRMAGISIPVMPSRGHIIVTEVTFPVTERFIGEIGGLAIPESNGKSAKTSDTGSDFGFCFSQTEEGNCLIGLSHEFLGYDVQTNFKVIRMIARRAIRFIPILRDVKCVRTFVGLRPYTPDGLPILSGVEDLKGFFVATGHDSKGIMLGPASGRFLSELILGHRLDNNAFEFSRFARSNLC